MCVSYKPSTDHPRVSVTVWEPKLISVFCIRCIGMERLYAQMETGRFWRSTGSICAVWEYLVTGYCLVWQVSRWGVSSTPLWSTEKWKLCQGVCVGSLAFNRDLVEMRIVFVIHGGRICEFWFFDICGEIASSLRQQSMICVDLYLDIQL